jgi:hypothetical protein
MRFNAKDYSLCLRLVRSLEFIRGLQANWILIRGSNFEGRLESVVVDPKVLKEGRDSCCLISKKGKSLN